MTYIYRTKDDERLHRRSVDFVRFIVGLRQITRDSHIDAESKERFLTESALWSVRSRNIERSAKLPMSIALFGPSQCGKSYLVNEMARRDMSALNIRCTDGIVLNFWMNLILPAAKRYRQVTRFTCFDRPPEDPNYPFHIRLLSPPIS